MKKTVPLLLIVIVIASCSQRQASDRYSTQFIDSTEMTNNFYDNTETFSLPVTDLYVDGEIENPGKVDFSGLPVRSVIVKETLLDDKGGDRFTGAFRYDGYSLFDILEKRIIQKVNSAEFNPIIDLYVEVEGSGGEKAVFSWGEIYYPNNLHKIIVASAVSRIVPSKTKDVWELPGSSKIVAATDLITERNISSPVRITVRSCPLSFDVVKGMSQMYSESITLYKGAEKTGEFSEIPGSLRPVTFNTIFYGRGKGIHSTSPFIGYMLKDVLKDLYPMSRVSLREGIMCITGRDGYRCALSYSEIFNRNDQQEFLLVKTEKGEDGGLFRMFGAADFFSDRAVKSVSSIHLGF
ncbi:MAG: hypothetical protein MUE74_11675 [Bacteroidales bacterium]|nr:hypothetical protein [Bacteroidales bacterium]